MTPCDLLEIKLETGLMKDPSNLPKPFSYLQACLRTRLL